MILEEYQVKAVKQMAKVKYIDLLELRELIKGGYYKVFTSKYAGARYIYIEDTENGECVRIGKVETDD